jgi:hypothetical protein
MAQKNGNPEHSNPGDDYTKTRKYAYWDLMIKAISALAIVGIGLVTYSLQQHVEDVKERDEKRDIEERRYLPVLRSSSETGALLIEVATQYGYPEGTKSEALDESKLGARLSYAASSLQFPDRREPTFAVDVARDIAADRPNPRHIRLPARQAVLLLGEIMRFAPLMLDMAQKKATVRAVGDGLVFSFGDTIQTVATGDRTRTAWMAWLEGTSHQAKVIYWLDLPTIADDLDRQLTAMNDSVITAHPTLAKEYIEIRADVLRSRQQLAAH